MNDDQLEAALHDRRQELFNLRFQAATGALENTARLKLAKREIARILRLRARSVTPISASRIRSQGRAIEHLHHGHSGH